jgi:hypothetical protein
MLEAERWWSLMIEIKVSGWRYHYRGQLWLETWFSGWLWGKMEKNRMSRTHLNWRALRFRVETNIFLPERQ